MLGFLKNIRFYVLCLAILFSIAIFVGVFLKIPEGSLRIIKLTQLYALTTLSLLYITLLIGPATYVFRWIPFRGDIYRARRAIGVSTFYFAVLHASFAFFGELGGFRGLFFLSNKYLLAISLSFTALCILAAMASTSFDFMVIKLGTKWKLLHRFIYLVAVLILVHALMLGTHFQDISGWIPQIFLGAFAVLLLLEANRFDAYLSRRLVNLPRFGISLVVVIGLISSYFLYSFLPQDAALSIGIHAAHIQLAKQAQGGSTANLPTNLANIPGLQGDRTKRFTVSFNRPDLVSPNQDVTLRFQVFDASSGNQVQLFSTVYEKLMHLIIVDSSLNYFSHIHPVQDANGFTITTQFPKDGEYHLYINFQPLGAIEQQFAFTLKVGSGALQLSSAVPDDDQTKTFGDYMVSVSHPKPLLAAQLSVGGQRLKFTMRDKNGNAVTNLKPYLAAFGHLVIINEQTFDYLHVHPANLVAPKPDAVSGPDVEFLPIGIYGPVKPGTYRVFAEFNPGGKLFVSDFTVEVK